MKTHIVSGLEYPTTYSRVSIEVAGITVLSDANQQQFLDYLFGRVADDDILMIEGDRVPGYRMKQFVMKRNEQMKAKGGPTYDLHAA